MKAMKLERCIMPAARLRLKKMAKEAKGKTLDIGYAEMPNEFLSGDVVGFDIQSIPKPRNYSSIFAGNIDNINKFFKDETFDTILAGEVMEHLERPLDFLRSCNRLLKENGKLVLSTPNPYYPPEIIFNWLMEKKHLYCKDHLFLIPPRWMARILSYTGFKLKKMLSGGILLSTKIVIPCPWQICHQIIYVAIKQKSINEIKVYT